MERYNRAMNEQFATPHPPLLLFVQTIEEEVRNQVQRLRDLKAGRIVPRVLAETTINAVPLCYTRFELV